MARYLGPKNRIARKYGTNIFGRLKNPLAKKPHPPGQHGAKRKKKSDYGMQLDEKQKLKACYGMLTEKQLMRYYEKAVAHHGDVANKLLQALECRLDNIVYRLRFAPTIFAAQQLVAHGHVLVDGKKVDIRSFVVHPGMKISLREKSREILVVKNAIEHGSRTVPEYLSMDPNTASGSLLVLPTIDQIQLALPINIHTVCDFLAYHG
ncbi:MAG: 30S ribosomal protein S4 [Chlamydiia bacterium]